MNGEAGGFQKTSGVRTYLSRLRAASCRSSPMSAWPWGT